MISPRALRMVMGLPEPPPGYWRSRFLARWFYVRHFLSELGPIAACIFVIVGLLWAAMLTGWLATCAVTLWFAPWCS